MPQYAEGDLWEAEVGRADLLLVTTNACLRTTDNGLVMGRGAARQMVDRFPGIEREAGKVLVQTGREFYMIQGRERPVKPYGLLLLPHSVSQAGKETWLGLFQVKWHWSDPADPELIDFSASALADFLQMFDPMRVALNYPGIGNGHLSEAAVRPILDARLPESVVVYQLPRPTDTPSSQRRPLRAQEIAAV